VTQRQSFAVLIAHMILSLAVLISASLLCYTGKLDASAVIALFGAAVGLMGGNAQALGASIVNGGPKPDYRQMGQSDPAALERMMDKQAPPPKEA
jgi:hypothetical protein